jgi:hypothetical protein
MMPRLNPEASVRSIGAHGGRVRPPGRPTIVTVLPEPR